MGKRDVHLHSPSLGEREYEAVTDVLDSGELKGGGRYDDRCANLIEKSFGASTALTTPSCTHALEMTALLLDISPDDEVIVPSYTFPSTATAFLLRGATITFCDIDPETLNMDPSHFAELASAETAAVVPVHYAGLPCEMDRICSIATDYDIAVVEDAAQGVNAKYRDEYLGTIGDFGCYSFHGTKSYVAGEGGALIISDKQYVERAEVLRQKGTNYDQFRRGEVEKYEWVDVGSSYVPSELQCALAYTQLNRRDEIREARESVYHYYLDTLGPLERAGEIELPTLPSNCTPNYHLFYLLAGSEQERDALVAHLQEQNIGAAQHYEPLHTGPKGREIGYGPGDLPVTEECAPRLLRIPVHQNVSKSDRRHVVNAVNEFYGH
jgi:dTDP-4-amino-4,6-dideoxygalactose transaminase